MMLYRRRAQGVEGSALLTTGITHSACELAATGDMDKDNERDVEMPKLAAQSSRRSSSQACRPTLA